LNLQSSDYKAGVLTSRPPSLDVYTKSLVFLNGIDRSVALRGLLNCLVTVVKRLYVYLLSYKFANLFHISSLPSSLNNIYDVCQLITFARLLYI